MSRAGRFVLLAILLFANAVPGQTNTPVPPPANQAIAEAFDVKAAVEAYLAKMPPAQRARSDAYFENGYWLLLWDFLSTVVVMWFIHFQTEEDTVLFVSDHRVKVAERDLRFLIEMQSWPAQPTSRWLLESSQRIVSLRLGIFGRNTSNREI